MMAHKEIMKWTIDANEHDAAMILCTLAGAYGACKDELEKNQFFGRMGYYIEKREESNCESAL